MSVTVKWYDDEQTILKYTYGTHWSWVELQDALQEGRGLQSEKSYSVCVIHDLYETLSFPPSLISNMKHYINQKPENIGMVAFVSRRMFLNSLYRVFRQMFPNLVGQYIHTTTVEEALKRINSWQTETNQDCSV